jgi:hypothetical protein
MASLRQAFDTWMDSEPEELETDRPTDAEMTAFEEAEKNHTKQVGHHMCHHFVLVFSRWYMLFLIYVFPICLLVSNSGASRG